MPGIRVVPARNGSGNQVTMTRGAGGRTCYPTMYVHSMPYSGTLEDFSADDIEALEIYVGISEIPPELFTSSDQSASVGSASNLKPAVTGMIVSTVARPPTNRTR